jgi:hypothetical protein
VSNALSISQNTAAADMLLKLLKFGKILCPSRVQDAGSD